MSRRPTVCQTLSWMFPSLIFTSLLSLIKWTYHAPIARRAKWIASAGSRAVGKLHPHVCRVGGGRWDAFQCRSMLRRIVHQHSLCRRSTRPRPVLEQGPLVVGLTSLHIVYTYSAKLQRVWPRISWHLWRPCLNCRQGWSLLVRQLVEPRSVATVRNWWFLDDQRLEIIVASMALILNTR